TLLHSGGLRPLSIAFWPIHLSSLLSRMIMCEKVLPKSYPGDLMSAAKKQAFPARPEVPISKAVRAGDFVFTSAYGPWTFDPAKVTYADDGTVLDDGTAKANQDMPIAE